MSVNYLINQLLNYGLKNNLIEEHDVIYCANRLIDILKVKTFELEETNDIEINDLLVKLCDYAYEQGILNSNDITTYDLFDTLLMDVIMPRPSEVLNKFNSKFIKNKEEATNYFYDLAIKSNYIRMDRINKNICFKHNCEYGTLDITINLSKPEKDPKMIALAKTIKSTGYPKCLLCYENMGFAGHLNHPARQNHRIIPLVLDNENYFIQYSPYVYYNEHSIVFNKEHKPMVIDKAAFSKLLDFVRQYDHYFIGSNADLPIVGGSILAHDHFQGGKYNFTMFDAKIISDYKLEKYPNVDIEYINWPLDTLRIKGTNKEELANLAELILNKWINYSRPEIEVLSFTGETRHNTITPIVRNNKGVYEMYLVLRNNRTNDKYPDGIYHPKQSLHHIKKENIGLIEVMGLAVLPKRLKEEMDLLKKVLLGISPKEELNNEPLLKHKEWAEEVFVKYELNENNINEIVNYEIGEVFKQVLLDCGVFKFGNKKEEMDLFVKYINE